MPSEQFAEPAPPSDVTETQQPPPENLSIAAAPDEVGWASVKSFNGKDGATTPAFNISGSKWRINWRVTTQEPQYAAFEALIYRGKGSDWLIDRVSYSPDTSNGVFIVNEGGNDYYLKVICANLDKWAIDIEEYGTETPIQPVQITYIRYLGQSYDVARAGGHEIAEWDEYVEIKNFSDSPQDIAGWQLKNITKGQPTFIFPSVRPCSCEEMGSWQDCFEECYPPKPCTIDARSSIRVYTGEPDYSNGGYCFYYYLGNIWDNQTPDTAVLYNAQGQEVSRRSYIIAN